MPFLCSPNCHQGSSFAWFMTASRDLQLCPECIQLYLISAFRITFYHYLDNFSAEERQYANVIYLNIWYIQTSHSIWRKNCIKYIFNITGLFSPALSGWAVNYSDSARGRGWWAEPWGNPCCCDTAWAPELGVCVDLVHQELPLLCHLATAPLSRKLRRTDY